MSKVNSTTIQNNLNGVWRSRYLYESSSRKGEFDNEHYVLVEQHGDMLTLTGLPHTTESRLELRLQKDGRVLTGTWREHTAPRGYYKGKVYHGAIQLALDEDHKHMTGKWVGFGKGMEINTGIWEFTRIGGKDALLKVQAQEA